jgi:hypothetical protein
MTEKTDANSLGAALLDWDDGLQKYRRGARSNGVAFYVPNLGQEEAAKHPVPADACVHKSVPRIIE